MKVWKQKNLEGIRSKRREYDIFFLNRKNGIFGVGIRSFLSRYAKRAKAKEIIQFGTRRTGCKVLGDQLVVIRIFPKNSR